MSSPPHSFPILQNPIPHHHGHEVRLLRPGDDRHVNSGDHPDRSSRAPQWRDPVQHLSDAHRTHRSILHWQHPRHLQGGFYASSIAHLVLVMTWMLQPVSTFDVNHFLNGKRVFDIVTTRPKVAVPKPLPSLRLSPDFLVTRIGHQRFGAENSSRRDFFLKKNRSHLLRLVFANRI